MSSAQPRVFPGGSDGKESASDAGDPGSIPELGRSPGEGNGNQLQFSCLKNSMDRGAWQATVHGVTKSPTQLSDFDFADQLRLKVGSSQPSGGSFSVLATLAWVSQPSVCIPGEHASLGVLERKGCCCRVTGCPVVTVMMSCV